MGFGTVLTQFGEFAPKADFAVEPDVGSGLESIKQSSRGVAQPGSAPALGAGGRRFKSSRPDQSSKVRPGDMGYRMYRLHR